MYFGYDGIDWCLLPTFGGDPQKSMALREAANRRDWREINRLGWVWYDRYADKWFKFGPHFWDVPPMEYFNLCKAEGRENFIKAQQWAAQCATYLAAQMLIQTQQAAVVQGPKPDHKLDRLCDTHPMASQSVRQPAPDGEDVGGHPPLPPVQSKLF